MSKKTRLNCWLDLKPCGKQTRFIKILNEFEKTLFTKREWELLMKVESGSFENDKIQNEYCDLVRKLLLKNHEKELREYLK